MTDMTMNREITAEEQKQFKIGEIKGFVEALNSVKKTIRLAVKDGISDESRQHLETAKIGVEKRVKFLRYRFFEDYEEDTTYDMLLEVYPNLTDEKLENLLDSIRDKVEREEARGNV